PLSLVGTLAVMYLANFSLNNLSIMALTIATGFVVDDAIVMIENIARYIEEGDDPFEAAFKGSSQIAFTVVSLTVSLIAVLITLVPMMCAQLLRRRDVVQEGAPPTTDRRAGTQAIGARWFSRLIDWYDRSLVVVFRHQTLTLIVAVGTVVLTVFLYIVIPKGF